jgi:hypothetical protein
MASNIYIKKNVIIYLILTCLTLSNAAEPEDGNSIKFQFLKGVSFDPVRVQALGKALDFQNWTKTDIFRVAPSIDKSMLRRPDLVTREGKSYSIVQFGQDSWGRCEWWADYLTEVDEASLPKELPADRIKTLMEHLDPERRNDPNFVERYLQGKLEGYRKSLKYHIEGSISVEIVVAPSSRAAHEYFLSRMTANTMDTRLMVSLYSKHKKVPGLGTMNIGCDFIRDNVLVRILKTEGKFSQQGLPIALNLDAQIKQQAPLTYEQLLARRPSITIATKAEKTLAEGQWTVSFGTSAPDGQEIVDVKSYVDGQLSWIEDKKVVITNKKKGQTVKVKVVATTGELLTNTLESEVTIPE